MAPAILLNTQVGQDFVGVPASQNVWLAGMAEGFLELGFSVHIPWSLRGTCPTANLELEYLQRRFLELYGVTGDRIEFFDAREVSGPSLPRRFDALWSRDPGLLSKRVSSSQVRIAEFHGGAKEVAIPEITRKEGVPLVTVTETWAERFGAQAVAEPGALRVFFNSRQERLASGSDGIAGIYAGGLDPDRIDGVGVLSLRQLVSERVSLEVLGGNLSVEVDVLRWLMGTRRKRVKFYGYVAPALAARLMHQADFAVALKSERSAPSAPIKLIAFAAAKLPLLVSPSFFRPDYSGEVARTLKAHAFAHGLNPRAGAALEKALSAQVADTAHNYEIALDNTFARRIEKTGLTKLLT